jgi:hypothetical protein
MTNKLLIGLVILMLGACKPKQLSPEQYMGWVNDKDNGLVKTETIGKVKYTVVYRPNDYQLAKSLIDQDSFALKSSKARNHAFIIKMEPADGKTQVLTIDATEREEPFQRINYYLSEAQQYISLVEGNDTLAPNNYIYERYYNVSPSQNLVLGFSQNKGLGSQDLQLVVEDKIFKTGKIYFRFDASTLKDIPKLITQ